MMTENQTILRTVNWAVIGWNLELSKLCRPMGERKEYTSNRKKRALRFSGLLQAEKSAVRADVKG